VPNPRNVVMLEFNELCPELLDRFIDQGELPSFSKLRKRSDAFITNAGESHPFLEPWIQWITVHTGMRYSEHRVFSLGDAQKLDCESIWDKLSKQGLPSWICGSMNVKIDSKKFCGSFIPDPWSQDILPSHAAFLPYYRFVQANVQEHSNPSYKMGLRDYLSFCRFMLMHGLSFYTVKSIIRQLLTEKFRGTEWRRAMLLDNIQWDLFKYQIKIVKPRFSTFFLNTVAHYQHKYWRHMEPERFAMQPSDEDVTKYGDAVLLGYRNFDRIIGDALRQYGETSTIVLCTALSQQPFSDYDESGGKTFYRPHSFSSLIEQLDLNCVVDVSPVMSEQFHLICNTESDAKRVEERLSSFSVDDEPLFYVRRDGSGVFSGCAIYREIGDSAPILVDGKCVAEMGSVFYRAESIKSGMHHPSGMFWISNEDPSHRSPKEIDLTEVMPILLKRLCG